MSTQQITITESGMHFGPFERSRCFHIEESQVYGTIRNHGVKMVEFLLLRTNDNIIKNNSPDNPEIWIVEAKSSSPCPDNKSNFKKFIDEIREKLINALSLGLASVLGRHEKFKPELPSAFTKISLSLVQVKFVVVMKNHPESALPPLKDALERALRPIIKSWGFAPNSVIVLNKALARKYGLIDTTS